MDTNLKPDRKTSVAGVSGAITVILIWIFSVVPPHVEIPGEVGAAITLVISFLFGYLTKESPEE